MREAERIEIGLRNFLSAGNFKAFTTTFEDLHGLQQPPGFSVQRLMRDGYAFGAEGDRKTAAFVRAMKVMNEGMNGGVSADGTWRATSWESRSLPRGSSVSPASDGGSSLFKRSMTN